MHSDLVRAVFNFGSDEILTKGKAKRAKFNLKEKGSLVMVAIRLFLTKVLHKCIHWKSHKTKQRAVMVWQKL